MHSKSTTNMLTRMIEILKIVSDNTPRRVGTKEILEKLQKKQITVSLKTIQRDLRTMQETGFPIEVDKNNPMGVKINKNNGWLAQILKQTTE